VRSKGCPTRTHAIPPNPPDRNDFTGSTVDIVSARMLSRSDAESDILLDDRWMRAMSEYYSL